MGVGKSRAKAYIQKDTGITFRDVAGQDEAKESLLSLIHICSFCSKLFPGSRSHHFRTDHFLFTGSIFLFLPGLQRKKCAVYAGWAGKAK